MSSTISAMRSTPTRRFVNMFYAFSDVRQAVVNAGTGKSRSFNDVAKALIEVHGSGRIE